MFEFARVIVWMHLLKATVNLSYVFIVVGAMAVITLLIVWAVSQGDDHILVQWTEEKRKNISVGFSKTMKWLVPMIGFFLVLAIFTPKPSRVIAYLSLKQVDKYNIENVESNYNPQEILGIVDETLQKAKEFLESQ